MRSFSCSGLAPGTSSSAPSVFQSASPLTQFRAWSPCQRESTSDL